MSGAVVSATFSAVQLVYAAYRDVRSNKERCATLVKRAEFVVDQLQSLINCQGEESVVEQLGVLQSAFEETARVIKDVGHQNWFMALLNSDRDTVQIEHCHRCLTDLMALCNIEQTIDQLTLQNANECSRRDDHNEMIYVAQGVQSELIAQGEMIGEVLQMVRSLSSQSFEENTQATSQTSPPRQRGTSPGGRAMMYGPTVTPGAHASTDPQTGLTLSTSGIPIPRRLRRQPWKDKWRLQMVPTGFRRSLPAIKTNTTKKAIKPTTVSGENQVCPGTLFTPPPLPGASECFQAKFFVQTSELPSSTPPSIPCGYGSPKSNNVSGASEPRLCPNVALTHSAYLAFNPAYPPRSSQSVACSGMHNGQERGTRPHTLTATRSPTVTPGQSTSPLRRPTDMEYSLSGPRAPSRPPCTSKYVEIRYYSGDVSSGVLHSQAFGALGQTSLSELKLACSRPSDPALLVRLDASSFVMRMPGNLQPTSMLRITPLMTHRYPVPIVWVLKSHAYNTHLEPIRLYSIKQNLGPEWALVACDKSTHVEGLMKTIGELLDVKPRRCFCREEGGRFQIPKTQLLRDCGVGRGMYLEVEVE